jgi:hypothetical protein
MNRRAFLGAFAATGAGLLVPKSALSEDRSIALVPDMKSAEAYARALPVLQPMDPEQEEELYRAGDVEDMPHSTYSKGPDLFFVERLVDREGRSRGVQLGIDTAPEILDKAIRGGLFPIESHHRGEVLKGVVFACTEAEFERLLRG